jgi:hypothetical protein
MDGHIKVYRPEIDVWSEVGEDHLGSVGFQAVGDVKELEVIATAVRSDPNLATIEQRIPVKQGQLHTHGSMPNAS